MTPLFINTRCVQVLAELHELVNYRARYMGGSSALPILALGLSSRKNLCCHPTVSGKSPGQRALQP